MALPLVSHLGPRGSRRGEARAGRSTALLETGAAPGRRGGVDDRRALAAQVPLASERDVGGTSTSQHILIGWVPLLPSGITNQHSGGATGCSSGLRVISAGVCERGGVGGGGGGGHPFLNLVPS